MSNRYTRAVVLVAFLMLATWSDARAAAPDPPHSYYAYVCAESDDEVAVVRYGPGGLEVAKTVVVGSFPAETEGRHGIKVDPDGRHWYISIAHGLPFGSVQKFTTGTDE